VRCVSWSRGRTFGSPESLAPGGLLNNEHRFRVAPIDADTCRFLAGQTCRGLPVRLLIPRRSAASCEIIQEINEALRQRVPAAAGSVDDIHP